MCVWEGGRKREMDGRGYASFCVFLRIYEALMRWVREGGRSVSGRGSLKAVEASSSLEGRGRKRVVEQVGGLRSDVCCVV